MGKLHNTTGHSSSSSGIATRWYFFHGLIFVFSFLLYFNSTFNDYNLDDELVTRNHKLTSKGIGAIPEIFNSPYYSDESGYRYEYRPLVLASFAVEHSLLGENAFYSHLINVLLYAACCVVLFMFLKRLLAGYSLLIPICASLLYAAHPTHTEVVDSIKNRDEILVLLFGLLSMHLSLLFADNRKWYYPILGAICLMLAMLAKPSAAVFVFLVPLSLLMFREVRFRYLALLTVLLYLPTVALSRIYFLSQQLAVLFALLATLFVLHFLRNKVGAFSFKSLLPKIETAPKTESYAESVSAFQWVIGLAVAVLLTGICMVGVLMPLWWLFAISGSLLLMCCFLLPVNSRIVFWPFIALIVSAFTIRYKLTNSLPEAALLLFLYTPFLSNDRRWKISAITGWVIYAATTAIFLHSFFSLAIFVFAVFIYRQFLPLSLLMLIGFATAIGFSLLQDLQGFFNYSIFSFVFLVGAFALLWWRKTKPVQQSALWLIPLAFAFMFVTNPVRFTQTQNMHVDYQLKALQFTRAVDLTPSNTYRPLKYLEAPVTNLDSWNIRLGTAMNVLGRYLKLVVIPWPLNFYYGYPTISATDFFSALPVIIFLLHLLLSFVALWFIKRNPLLSYSISFYLASIAVFSTLPVAIPGMMGDRFLLIPSLGFCLIVAWILIYYFEKDEKKFFTGFDNISVGLKYSLLALLIVYSTITFSRNLQWKNHVTLFSHDVSVNGTSAQAQNLLGLHLFIQSNQTQDATEQIKLRETAIEHFKKALVLYPRLMNSAYDMARCYDALGKPADAYKAYQLTTEIDSTFYAPYFALALYEHNTGNLPAAIAHYEKFIHKYPFQMEAYANLSFAYFSMEQYEKSIETNRRALKIYPTAFEPMVNIGKTFFRIHQRDSALYYFETANRLVPGNADVKNMIEQLKLSK